MTERRARDATAGVVVALILCAAAWPGTGAGGRDPSHPACDGQWVEVSSADGSTMSARCADGVDAGAQRFAVRGPTRLLFGLPIALNRAEPDTLEVLPGIGPGRAAAIVRERCRDPFDVLADVQRVPGIGPRTREGLRGWAIAGEPAPDLCGPSTLPP